MTPPPASPPRLASRNTVAGLLDSLQAHSALSAAEALHLIGQLALWQHTTHMPSRQTQLPGLIEDAAPSGAELRELFRGSIALRRGLKKLDLQHLELAFPKSLPIRYELLQPKVIGRLIQDVDAALAKFGAHGFAEDLVEQWSTVHGSGVGIAREVADFMATLATPPERSALNCLGVAAEAVAIASMRLGGTPTLVSARPPAAAVLYALLTGASASFEVRDPLKPVDVGFFGTRFGPTFAAPALGVKEPGSRDGNFSSAEAAYVRYLAQDGAESAVILVSNRFLFTRGPEEKLRRTLVDEGRLRAVIAFPAGLLSAAYVPFALLVLGRPEHERQTIFCRVEDTRHLSATAGKVRTHDRHFIGHEEILSALAAPIAPWSRAVSRTEIETREYVLSVERYLATNAEAAIERAAGARAIARLGDLVTIVKPQALRAPNQAHEAIEVCEIGPAEIPAFKYLGRAGRLRLVDHYDLERYAQQTLQPDDVLLSVKGTIGRSAIAPPAAFEGPNVPSQACVILRLKRAAAIQDPIVLHMVLRSPLFQTLLRAVTTGTTIPNVTLGDLRQLQLIVPTDPEQKCLKRVFESQLTIQRQLEALRAQQDRADAEAWAAIGLAIPAEAPA